MTTVVNNPAPTPGSGCNGFLVGVIVLVGFVAVLLYFGIPAIKRMRPIEVTIPAPQVNMPDEIDVNVNPTN